MPKKISMKLKRQVITDLVKNEKTQKDIAIDRHISLPTLLKIRRENIDLYAKILQTKRDCIGARACFTAEKVLKRIKKDKIENSSALQLSQTAKNLIEISDNKDKDTKIIFNQIPKSKEELINSILDAEVVEKVDNESMPSQTNAKIDITES